MGVAEREDELETELPNEEVTEEEVEQAEADETETEGGDDGEDEDVVQIGDEEPPASEEANEGSKLVRHLRAELKAKGKELAQLKQQVPAGKSAEGKPELPQKPKLADFEFDEDEHDKALDAWHAKKREVESWEASQQRAIDERKKQGQAVHENYLKSKTALKVKNFQDLEDEVMRQFPEDWKQSIVMVGAANPALMIAALGSSPKKLQELASIKDPVKFTWACAQLEKEVKVTKRPGNSKPAPESTVRSGSGSAPATSATLERLQAEAAKTGDRTKVAAYLRQQRASGK